MKTFAVILVVVIAALGWTTYRVKSTQVKDWPSTVAQSNPAPTTPAEDEKLAPGFTLSSTTGQDVSLVDAGGKKLTLLYFWASWCPPCLGTMPTLSEFEAKYGPDGLKIISINKKEDTQTVQRIVRQKGFTPLALLDTDGSVSDEYSAKTLPTFVLINADGSIVSTFTGFQCVMQGNLEAAICNALGVKPPDDPYRRMRRHGRS